MVNLVSWCKRKAYLFDIDLGIEFENQSALKAEDS